MPFSLPTRLPFPYRPGADVVAGHSAALSSALYWAAAARHAQPLVQAVRHNPPQFWAMENLLKEYPISSAEGLTLMRLAEALLRVPDADTAIALTADQLGRADFDGATDGPCSRVMARLSASAIDLSKKFLPEGGQLTPMSRLGALRGGRHAAGRAAVGPTVCAGTDDWRGDEGSLELTAAPTGLHPLLSTLVQMKIELDS